MHPNTKTNQKSADVKTQGDKMAYPKWSIVKGKSISDKRPKRYMMRDDDGVITYHNFKEVVHTWQTRYGPYNTIKEKAGRAVFYNVYGETQIEVLEKLNIEVNSKTIFVFD